MHRRNDHPTGFGARRQRGMAALFVSIILLVAITVMTLSVARSSLLVQRTSGNEYRAKEVAQAAEAALEYGAAWLATTAPTWSAAVSGIESASPTGTLPTITSTNSSYVYNLSVTYTRATANPDFVKITATASASTDASISASITQYARPKMLLDPGGVNAPPLLIEDCTSGITGNPDIFPEGYSTGGTLGTAIATAHGPTNGASPCLDTGHLNVNGGATSTSAFSGDVWNYVFGITREEFQALADAEASLPANQRTYWWITSTSNFHDSLGSATHPVYVVFAASANCPTINGGVTIYGIVYVDSTCTGANGWGNTDIYGSLIVNGGVSQLNANTRLHHFSESGTPGGPGNPVVSAPKVIGTWKDF